MADVQARVRAFTECWHAGLRPDVAAFLAAVPARQQGELADALQAFLSDGPPPRYDEHTLAALESSQPVREAVRAIDGQAGTWPLLLPALRRQRRLRQADVAQRLASELGFPSAQERVREHLHDMECGTADARRVSARVLTALARVLGITGSDLARAGGVSTLGDSPSDLTPTRRGFRDPPPFSEVPSGYRQPDAPDRPEWTEVDRLFLGNHR